jgi:hypothetical protein
MKVQVLRSAMEDLAAGRQFYDRQEVRQGGQAFLPTVYNTKSIKLSM